MKNLNVKYYIIQNKKKAQKTQVKVPVKMKKTNNLDFLIN